MGVTFIEWTGTPNGNLTSRKSFITGADVNPVRILLSSISKGPPISLYSTFNSYMYLPRNWPWATCKTNDST